MSDSSFELIMQEVLNQKQRLEDLIEENQDLKRQLTDLREGHGILLNICGEQFTLVRGEVVASPQGVSQLQDFSASYQETVNMTLSEAPMGTVPETPLPSYDEFEQAASYLDQEVEEVNEEEVLQTATPSSTLLEDMLIDEFAAAATTPMTAAVWQGDATRKDSSIDEEEKAALRKELIGSFLLE
jgi:hypothetical protein